MVEDGDEEDDHDHGHVGVEVRTTKKLVLDKINDLSTRILSTKFRLFQVPLLRPRSKVVRGSSVPKELE